jgi:hypothetical protein
MSVSLFNFHDNLIKEVRFPEGEVLVERTFMYLVQGHI